jgi:hypothetical protein
MQITPLHGPWAQIVLLLQNCSTGLDSTNDPTPINNQKMGPVANRIALIAHMLCDDRVKSVMMTLTSSANTSRFNQPAMLDQTKVTGVSLQQSVYNEIFHNYKLWQQDYYNTFGQDHPELQYYDPQDAIFNNPAEIKQLISKVASHVRKTKKKLESSGYNRTGMERLQDALLSHGTGKGKNYDHSLFYAFVMLDEVDLTFVSRHLNDNVGIEAGLGTEGGGEVAFLPKKARVNSMSDEILSKVSNLTDRATELLESDSHSSRMYGRPMQGSDSRSYGHVAHGNGAYYSPYQSLGDSAKKAKTEEKMMRYNAIISHHHWVLSTPGFSEEELKHSRSELSRLMTKIEFDDD